MGQIEKLTIIRTEDGSSTLYSPELDETYHSSKGALAESRHVFIKQGLEFFVHEQIQGSTVNVLEVGLGTGLNAALAVGLAKNYPHIKFKYFGLEPFPLSEALIEEVGYGQVLSVEEAKWLKAIAEAEWGKSIDILPNFELNKLEVRLEDYHPNELFDVVFFDAFAPTKQPDVWVENNFKKLFENMEGKGVLTSYCVKGDFKRGLKAVGFDIKKLQGPPRGKREMLRAIKHD